MSDDGFVWMDDCRTRPRGTPARQSEVPRVIDLVGWEAPASPPADPTLHDVVRLLGSWMTRTLPRRLAGARERLPGWARRRLSAAALGQGWGWGG